MKFWDFFINQAFKKDKDGNDLFFPWGALGKGYVLDSPETKQKIQKLFRLYYWIGFPTLFLWCVAINPYFINQVLRQTLYANLYLSRDDFMWVIMGNLLWAELPIILVSILGSLLWWYLGIRPLVKNLPISPVKLGWGEAYKTNAKALHPVFLWVALIFFILVILVILFQLLQGSIPVAFGLFIILFCGLGMLGYAYMINLRNKP